MISRKKYLISSIMEGKLVIAIIIFLLILALAGCNNALEKPSVVTDGSGCYAVNFGGVISNDTCMTKDNAEKFAKIWYHNVKEALDRKEKVKSIYK